ncbi:hypothetical protein H6G00_31890 [Leptolyngbya sp. FACHB-541]|uniref:hypothetical protein n=1 Tax=Leptolyngbya sp. FACHB-541 TaxID=2692810 RepID=UPI001689BF9A|nr:hypothetical protein [Leptolyngbya sp. FACHB-541]MBD2001143.1 hypothetical protein [Leptolyngbya sp. FACHB-541]
MVSAILRVIGTRTGATISALSSRAQSGGVIKPSSQSVLLQQLVSGFASSAVLVIGIDDTIEWRGGKLVEAQGIYRDPVGSSQSRFVRMSGLQWLSLMLLVEIPWAKRVWVLPFLTTLTPLERYQQHQGQRHKTPVEWSQQVLKQVQGTFTSWLLKLFDYQRDCTADSQPSFHNKSIIAIVSSNRSGYRQTYSPTDITELLFGIGTG